MRVYIRDGGLQRAALDLGEIAFRAESRRLLADSEPELRASAGRRFLKGIRPAGRAWRLKKRREGLSAGRFEVSGTAKNALVRGTGKGTTALIFRVTKDGLLWGVRPGRSDLYYVRAHAAGYRSRSGGTIKPRQAVVIDKVAKERIAQQVLDGIGGL